MINDVFGATLEKSIVHPLRVVDTSDSTRELDVGNARITHLADPKAPTDAINKKTFDELKEEATKEFEGIKEETNKIKQDTQVLKQSVDDTDRVLKQSLQAFNNSKADFDTKNNQINQIKADVNSDATAIKKDKEAISGLKAQIELSKQTFSDLQRQVETKLQEATRYLQDTSNLSQINKEEVTALKDRAGEILESIKTLKTQIEQTNATALQSINEAKTDYISSSTATLERINQALQAITLDKQAIANDKASVEALSQHLTTLKQELEELKSQIEGVLKSGVINDEAKGTQQTYSSAKIEDTFAKLTDGKVDETVLPDSVVKVDSTGKIAKDKLPELAPPVNDSNPSEQGLYSSKKIDDTFAKLEGGTIVRLDTHNKIDTGLLKDDVVKLSSGKIADSLLSDKVVLKSEDKIDSDLIKDDIARTTQIPSLSGYATESFVTSKGYLTSSSLSSHATQSWCNSNFRTSSQVESAITSKGYITQSLADTRYNKADYYTQSSSSVNLNSANNFTLTLSSSSTITLSGGRQGQSGVIVVMDGSKIAGFSSSCKFKRAPSSFGGVELFAYFVKDTSNYIMGRVQ